MMARRGARGAGRAGAHRAGPGQNGWTQLHYAARNGRVEVAEKLLAAGAAVGATNNVRAPRAGEGVAGVFTIVICCQPLFRFLFSFCSCFSGGREGGRISCCVAGEGQQGGAGRRAQAGAHRAGPGQNGYTPLHVAAIWGRVEVAEKLLAAGAAVGATDDVRAPRAGEGVRRGVYNSDLLSASFSIPF